MEKLINVKQAAKMLSVHPNSIMNWINRGIIKTRRIPGTRRHFMFESDLIKLITPEVSE